MTVAREAIGSFVVLVAALLAFRGLGLGADCNQNGVDDAAEIAAQPDHDNQWAVDHDI